MTSKNNTCFVYITLPGETKPVTAGKLVINDTDIGAVGRFIYGKSYLSRPQAVAIDPIELKLTDKIYDTVKMGGVFGAIRDASPDHWGRRVIQKELNRIDVSEMEYLLKSPDDRIGALGFGLNNEPPAPLYEFNKTLDLERLQIIADKIISGDYAEDNITEKHERVQAEELLLIGTSMGGARPKAVVYDDNSLWLAKFNTNRDNWNNTLVEHAMLNLAAACGLNVAQSKTLRIGSRDVLLVKRFDREYAKDGFFRNRMFSALTALRSDDSPTLRENWSYPALVEELRRFSHAPREDAKELFMRMVFNSLITNTDDHPRNHAFIAREGNKWRLAPAYDLTPSPVLSQRRDLAMAVGKHGRGANIENLTSECERFLLEPPQAESIIKTMAEIVGSNWYRVMRSAGVNETDCEKLNAAFVYDGFWACRDW
ncbi:MAG: HipA domain-containing protein [Chitinispirillales bacterium]|jgi:serine/threonine-protein kinase HipA|nr:HipA domain-containing protein [Chitinispirillales bacterium]